MLPSLLLSLTLAAYGLPPGAPSLDPDKSIAQFVVDTWSVDDGLPQNTVTAVLQSRSGYLWLGTEVGLVRFNGRDFVVLDRAPHHLSTEVLSLAEDSSGLLWVGTIEGLVALDGPKHEIVFRDAEGSQIEALASGHDGGVWAGTWSSGLLHCKTNGCTTIGGSTAIGRIQSVVSTPLVTWVGSDQGLFRVGDQGLEAVPLDEPLVVTAMEGLPDGSLLVARRDGPPLRVSADGQKERLLPSGGWPSERIWSIMSDGQGSLWFGMESQRLVRRVNAGLDQYDASNGLPGTRVLALHEDREGSVWVGTEGGGLLRFRDGAFTTIGGSAGLSEEYVMTITQRSDGAILAGTYGGGVNILDPATLQVRGQLDGTPSPNVTGVLDDGMGNIYVATIDAGVSVIRGDRSTRLRGLPSESVYALFRSVSGGVWIGTDAGLARVEDGVTTVLTVDDGLSSNSIVDIEDDGQGTVWIGTYGGGLTVLLPDGQRRTYSVKDGLDSDIVSTLHLDQQGVLWIGTLGGGLAILTDGHIRSFSVPDGLFDRSVFQILEDESGYLWMGSNRGIARIRKQDILDYAAGRIALIPHESFGTDDGLKTQEINGGAQPSGWKSTDGRLWFPTVAGVAVVDPADLSRNTVPPPVAIERVEADGVVVEGPSISLPRGTRRVEFKFAALSLIDASAVSYRYRLDGKEDEWNTAMAGNTATYTFLDPGTYTFRVTAANNDGVWNDEGASVTFGLQPYFWQTSWFWMLVASTGFLVGALFFHSRTRHLKRQRVELEQMVEARTRDVMAAKDQIQAQSDALRDSLREKEVLLREVHHRVKNNLQMISSLLQLQSRQVTDADTRLLFEECRNRIYSFSMVHERLYRAKDMAHFDFVEYLNGLTEQLVRSHERNDREIELVTEIGSSTMDVDKVIPCGLIVTEFVTNALRHAFEDRSAGRISVRFAEEENFGVLVVEDDGRGLSTKLAAARKAGLGLHLVDALVSRLRGEMDIERRPEGGTRCTVRFPVGKSGLTVLTARTAAAI